MAEKYTPTFEDTEEYIPEFDATDELVAGDAVLPADVPQVPAVGYAESALQGLSQGATLGFGDEIAGAFEAGGRAVGLTGAGGPITDIGIAKGGPTLSGEELLKSYREGRSGQKGREAVAKEANPKTFMAAELGSALLTPGGVAAKGAGSALKGVSALSKLQKLKAAAPAIGMGALTGLGVSEADLTKGGDELKKAIADTAIGAGLGIIMPKVLKGVGKKIGSFFDTNAIQKKAESKILAATVPPKKIIEKELLSSTGGTKGIGKALLGEITDETGNKVPIFKVMDSPDDVLRKVEIAINEQGNKIKPIMESAQERINQVIPKLSQEQEKSGSVMTNRILDNLVETGETLKKQVGGIDKFNRVLNKASEFVDSNPALQGFDLAELQSIKQSLGKQLSPRQWNQAIQAGQAIPEEKELVKNMYFLVKERIEELATKASTTGDDMGAQIKKLNGEFSNLIDARNVAELDVVRSLQGPSLTYKDFILPGLMGIHSGPAALATGAAIYATEKATGRKLGNLSQLITAKGLNKMANAIEKVKTPASKKLAKQVQKINEITNPSDRAASLVQLLKTHKELGGIEIKGDKDVADKKSLLPAKSTSIIESSPEEVQTIIQRVEQSENKSHKNFMGPLQKAANAPERSRQAILFGLYQQPAFREMLDNMEEEK